MRGHFTSGWWGRQQDLHAGKADWPHRGVGSIYAESARADDQSEIRSVAEKPDGTPPVPVIMYGLQKGARVMVRAVLTFSLFALIAAAVASQPRSSSSLTIEQLIDIRHPSQPAWSPASRHVAYLSERAGIANIYVDATAVTQFADGVNG